MSSADEFCDDLIRTLKRAHDRTIEEDGGSRGILNEGLLDQAVRRAWSIYFGIDLYPHPFQKAAAIAEAIAHHHAFVDGNKRTASIAMRFVLLAFDYKLRNRIEDRIALLEAAAAGMSSVETIRTYIEQYAQPIPTS